MEDYNFSRSACSLPDKKAGIIALVEQRHRAISLRANPVQRGDFARHQAARTPRVAPLPLTVAMG